MGWWVIEERDRKKASTLVKTEAALSICHPSLYVGEIDQAQDWTRNSRKIGFFPFLPVARFKRQGSQLETTR